MKDLTIKQLITFLPTQKLEEVEKFYSEHLKLEKILDQGDCLIFKVISGAYIGFCKRNYEESKNQIILTLVTDQVDDYYQSLIQSGVVCEASPKINEKYRIYHFFIKDPNGYLVEIQQFLDGFDEV